VLPDARPWPRYSIVTAVHNQGRYLGVPVDLRGLLEALANHDSSGNSYVLLLGPDEPQPPVSAAISSGSRRALTSSPG
jgi:hypothetical protein